MSSNFLYITSLFSLNFFRSVQKINRKENNRNQHYTLINLIWSKNV